MGTGKPYDLNMLSLMAPPPEERKENTNVTKSKHWSVESGDDWLSAVSRGAGK